MSDQKANVPSYIERLRKPGGLPPSIQREVADIMQHQADELERLEAEVAAAWKAARQMTGPDGELEYKYNTFDEWREALAEAENGDTV